MKRILFFTYHHLRSNRQSGVLDYIRMLGNRGFAIDIVTVPTHLFWIAQNNDRESPLNLLKLILGIQEGNIRNWGFPRIMPGRISRTIFKDYRVAGSFTNIAIRLKKRYNLIVFESTECIEYFEKIKHKYPKTKIIYRASDPIAMYSSNSFLIQKEREIIAQCDEAWVLDTDTINFYNKHGFCINKCKVIPNYYYSNNDISVIEKLVLDSSSRNCIVYFGAQPIDYKLLCEVGDQFPDEVFYIFGPYDLPSTNNVHYAGSRPMQEIYPYLARAKMMIIPYAINGSKNFYMKIGRKIAFAKLFGLPIVVINSAKFAESSDVIFADDTSQFIDGIAIFLNRHIDYYANHLKALTELDSYNYSNLEKVIDMLVSDICREENNDK